MAEARQLVKYTFLKVNPEALAWSAHERQLAGAEFGGLLESRAADGTLLTYSTVGLRGDCDLLIWQAADSVDAIQQAESRWRSTQLGPSLSVAHSFLAMMRPSPYLGRHRHPDQEGRRTRLKPVGGRYLFVYPMWKKRVGYRLPYEKRKAMMEAWARYCTTHGDSILADRVTRRDGGQITVRESVLAAVNWIISKIDASPLGLVEFQRRNPQGIPFQVWKDSNTSYVHRDGTLANSDAAIAAVEVQGYAYDALLGAAHLFETRAVEWRDRAQALRERVIRNLWMPAESYFAMGLDRDGEGRARWIESIASNGALLLDTALFDGLPTADLYVAGLVRRICSPDFMTEVGIRCRSASEGGLVDFQDYHGDWTVWMKETFDIARGLERQGLPRLARQIGIRLLNAVNVAGAHVEFLYVSPDQRVMYDFRACDLRSAAPDVIMGTNQPEAPITWTVTAALALKSWLGSSRKFPGTPVRPDGNAWRLALEAEVLDQVPQLAVHRTLAELRSAYARRGNFVLNLEGGVERDRRARARGRGSDRLDQIAA